MFTILGNPREMFTDSAFYSPKYHPSVAEQVEMAHKLSSSLYDHGNKKSKGQEMYIERAKKSGKWIHYNGNLINRLKTLKCPPKILSFTASSFQVKGLNLAL